jgi:hypothetical protein
MEKIDLEQNQNNKNGKTSRNASKSNRFNKAESKQKIGYPRAIRNKKRNEIVLKENLRNSYAQTLIKIFFTPHPTVRVFLIFVVLGSSSLASYMVIQAIKTYLIYGVSTTSRTIYETPTLFPKVQICNYNSFATEFAYNVTKMGKFDAITFSNEQKKKLGHDLKDILIECWFNLNPCNWTDFTWSYDNTYGNCYTFNSGFDLNGNKVDLKKSKITGPAFGLQLSMYVNIYEKLLDNVDSLAAVIHIGNSSNTTYYSSSGILITSGSQTSITVDREFKSILPKPYSNCEIVDSQLNKFRSDLEFYNLISTSEYAYTQQLCFVICIQKYYIQKYNCTIAHLPSLYNVSECNSHLLWNILKSDYVLRGTFIDKECLPLCPLECDQTLFKKAFSSVSLVGNTFFMSIIKNNPNLAKDFINRTVDISTAKDSFVIVKIFYDSLSYTLTTETPQMDIVSLLASIGGNLGLFLGMSVFTICEIIEVLIEIYFFNKININ